MATDKAYFDYYLERGITVFYKHSEELDEYLNQKYHNDRDVY